MSLSFSLAKVPWQWRSAKQARLNGKWRSLAAPFMTRYSALEDLFRSIGADYTTGGWESGVPPFYAQKKLAHATLAHLEAVLSGEASPAWQEAAVPRRRVGEFPKNWYTEDADLSNY